MCLFSWVNLNYAPIAPRNPHPTFALTKLKATGSMAEGLRIKLTDCRTIKIPMTRHGQKSKEMDMYFSIHIGRFTLTLSVSGEWTKIKSVTKTEVL